MWRCVIFHDRKFYGNITITTSLFIFKRCVFNTGNGANRLVQHRIQWTGQINWQGRNCVSFFEDFQHEPLLYESPRHYIRYDIILYSLLLKHVFVRNFQVIKIKSFIIVNSLSYYVRSIDLLRVLYPVCDLT